MAKLKKISPIVIEYFHLCTCMLTDKSKYTCTVCTPFCFASKLEFVFSGVWSGGKIIGQNLAFTNNATITYCS